MQRTIDARKDRCFNCRDTGGASEEAQTEQNGPRMPTFAASHDEEPLFRELGLSLRWDEQIRPIGAVAYDHGEAVVEAGARERVFEGTVYFPPDGSRRRWASEWHSVVIVTVDDDRVDGLTRIVGSGVTICWAFAEMIMSGVPRPVVGRAARRLAPKVAIETVERPPAA